MSPLNTTQWKSVVRNALFAFIGSAAGVFVVALNTHQAIDKGLLIVAITTGGVAALKFVQKLFTPTV